MITKYGIKVVTKQTRYYLHRLRLDCVSQHLQAKDEKELSVTAGDILHVVRSGPDSNWLLCRTALGEGLVPANLGACAQREPTPDAVDRGSCVSIVSP